MPFDDGVMKMAAYLDLGLDHVGSSYHRLDSSLAHFSVHSIGIGSVGQPSMTVRTVMKVVTLRRETIMVNSLLAASAKWVILAYCFGSCFAHASIAFAVVVTDSVEL